MNIGDSDNQWGNLSTNWSPWTLLPEKKKHNSVCCHETSLGQPSPYAPRMEYFTTFGQFLISLGINVGKDSIYMEQYVGFLSHRGTPSHHPFLDGISHYKPSSHWGIPHDYGNLHMGTLIRWHSMPCEVPLYVSRVARTFIEVGTWWSPWWKVLAFTKGMEKYGFQASKMGNFEENHGTFWHLTNKHGKIGGEP